jgi:hypothetical protein
LLLIYNAILTSLAQTANQSLKVVDHSLNMALAFG